jgi:hypothetical protein
MKPPKNSQTVGKPGGPRSNWNLKFDQILGPKRKRAWTCPAKTIPFAAINLNGWLKNYES